MKRNFKILFIFALVIFSSFGCMQAGKPEHSAVLAPDFILSDLNKNAYHSAEYRDKQPVVLFFWTTWCPFCRKELKALNDMHPQLSKEGFQLFAVNVGEDELKVSNFFMNSPLSFSVLLDKDTGVAHAYDIFGVPTFVIIDKKGVIVFRGNSFPLADYKRLTSQ